MKSDSIDLAKELNILYDEICTVSERMRECNSEFVQNIHPLFERDKKYQEFKLAILSVCYTTIRAGVNLPKYLKEIDVAINKNSYRFHATILEYSKYKNPWKTMEKKLGEKKYLEVLEAFYYDHFLTAQRFMLGAWRAKRKGDPFYMFKGPEL